MRLLLGLALVVGLSISAKLFDEAVPESLDLTNLEEKAFEAVEKGDLSHAVKYFELHAQQYSDDTVSWNNLGVARMRRAIERTLAGMKGNARKDFIAAARSFRRALKIQSQYDVVDDLPAKNLRDVLRAMAANFDMEPSEEDKLVLQLYGVPYESPNQVTQQEGPPMEAAGGAPEEGEEGEQRPGPGMGSKEALRERNIGPGNVIPNPALRLNTVDADLAPVEEDNASGIRGVEQGAVFELDELPEDFFDAVEDEAGEEQQEEEEKTVRMRVRANGEVPGEPDEDDPWDATLREHVAHVWGSKDDLGSDASLSSDEDDEWSHDTLPRIHEPMSREQWEEIKRKAKKDPSLSFVDEDPGWDTEAESFLASDFCNIPRRPNMTREEFDREFRDRRPVIYRDDETYFHPWTKDDVRAYFYLWGEAPVVGFAPIDRPATGGRHTSMRDFAASFRSGRNLSKWADETTYVFSPMVFDSIPELAQDFHVPPKVYELFDDPEHDPEPPTTRETGVRNNAKRHCRVSRLGFGSSGQGLPFHFHEEVGANHVIYGRKRWFLSIRSPPGGYHPRKTPADWAQTIRPTLKEEDLGEHGLLECTIRAGEIMYVPPMWYHSTLNVGHVINVTPACEYADSRIPEVRKKLHAVAKYVPGLQTTFQGDMMPWPRDQNREKNVREGLRLFPDDPSIRHFFGTHVLGTMQVEVRETQEQVREVLEKQRKRLNEKFPGNLRAVEEPIARVFGPEGAEANDEMHRFVMAEARAMLLEVGFANTMRKRAQKDGEEGEFFRTLLKQGEDALREVYVGLQSNPHQSELALVAGGLQSIFGNLEEAEKATRLAMALDELDATSCNRLVRILLKNDPPRTEEAERLCLDCMDRAMRRLRRRNNDEYVGYAYRELADSVRLYKQFAVGWVYDAMPSYSNVAMQWRLKKGFI